VRVDGAVCQHEQVRSGQGFLMARGGAKGHTPHRPHAGDRQLAGLVRRSVRPGELPTAGGAAPTGRATGAGGRKLKGIPLRDIGKLRKGKQRPALSPGELDTRFQAVRDRAAANVRTQRVKGKLSERLMVDRGPRGVGKFAREARAEAKANPNKFSSEKRRSIARTIRSLEQRLIETSPQTRRK